jgi:hypothetical protein
MKAFFRWAGDPYVHVLLVALVLLQLGSRVNPGEDASAEASQPAACERCGARVEGGFCPHIVTTTQVARATP